MRIAMLLVLLIIQASNCKSKDLFGKIGSLTEEQVQRAMSSVSERGSLTEREIQKSDIGVNSAILRKLKHVHQKSRELRKMQHEIQESQNVNSSRIKRSSSLDTSAKHAHPFFTSGQKEENGNGLEDLRQRILGFNNRAEISGALNPFTVHWELSLVKSAIITIGGNDENKINFYWKKTMNFFSRVDGYIRHLIQSGPIYKINCTCGNGGHPKGAIKAEAHILVFVNVLKLSDSILAQSQPCNESKHAGALRINVQRFSSYLESRSQATEYSFFTTIVHELFHLIGFHNRANYPADKKDATNLDSIIMNYFIGRDQEHVNNQFFPHDIMVPSSNISHPWELVITTFTLRYLELVNKEIVINIQYMSNDTFFNHLMNIDDFMNYTCEAESSERPRFDIYCPAVVPDLSKTSCLKTRMAFTKCTAGTYSNGCRGRKIDKNCLFSHSGKVVFGSVAHYFGDDSRCFDSPTKGAVCLKYKYEGSDLYIHYDTKVQKCSESSQVLTFDLGMKITCPELDKFARVEKMIKCTGKCSGNGFCVDGNCSCFPGFEGPNCASFKAGHFVQVSH
jgi:hypothetical protein